MESALQLPRVFAAYLPGQTLLHGAGSRLSTGTFQTSTSKMCAGTIVWTPLVRGQVTGANNYLDDEALASDWFPSMRSSFSPLFVVTVMRNTFRVLSGSTRVFFLL